MRFDAFRYIFPPRPATAIPRDSDYFKTLAKRAQWIAQPKANGQRNITYIDPEGNCQFWNRHRMKHQNWNCPPWLVEEFKQHVKVPLGSWHVIDSELLHAKDSSIKNTIYLYDVLVLNGVQLLGTTYAERYQKLLEITGNPKTGDPIIKLSEHIWLAGNIPSDKWDEAWTMTDISWIEGFVLKNPEGKLEPSFKEENNGSWLTRVRKPNKCYRF